jgi:hypothetical protein
VVVARWLVLVVAQAAIARQIILRLQEIKMSQLQLAVAAQAVVQPLALMVQIAFSQQSHQMAVVTAVQLVEFILQVQVVQAVAVSVMHFQILKLVRQAIRLQHHLHKVTMAAAA